MADSHPWIKDQGYTVTLGPDTKRKMEEESPVEPLVLLAEAQSGGLREGLGESAKAETLILDEGHCSLNAVNSEGRLNPR